MIKLSFGNIILEFSVFNLYKQPYDEEGEDKEANMIESIVENHIQIGSISNPLESCLVNSFESSEQLDQDISNACSWLDCSHIM